MKAEAVFPDIKNKIKEPSALYYLFGLGMLLAYAFWLYVPVQETFMQAYDFLDGTFIYFIARARAENFLFNLDQTIPMFSGLSLNFFGVRDLGLGEFFYEIFSPVQAVIANRVLAMFLGLSGFFLLGRDYIIKDRENHYALIILITISFLFAILPFKEQRFSGVSMIPFLLWAGLNIYHKKRMGLSFAIFLFYPFVSFLHYNGFAVALFLGALTGLLVFLRNERAFIFVVLTVVFGLTYAFLEYRSLAVVFHPDYQIVDSVRANIGYERDSFNLAKAGIWKELVYRMFFASGHHHLTNDFPIFSFMSLSFVYGTGFWFLWRGRGAFFKPAGYSQLSPAVSIGLITFATFILGFLYVVDWHHNILNIVFGLPLAFRRVETVSLPLLCVSVLIMALSLINREKRIQSGLTILFVVLLFATSILQNGYHKELMREALGIPREISLNTGIISILGGKPSSVENTQFDIKPLNRGMYREKEFFYMDAFEKITHLLESRLGKKTDYKAVSIGLHTTIPQYHGYHTIDGFFNNYPESFYFENLWPVIAPEMKLIGKTRKNMFIGRRMNALISKQNYRNGLIYPNYNWCAFLNLGGRVVFSAYPVGNAQEKELIEVVATGPIYVYMLDEDMNCG